MKNDIKDQFRENYLRYASYVILDRAIPSLVDGLKPVQRRILWTLFKMDDGKLHKVANVAGQTIALHPHGDAPIVEALVNLANKGYLLVTQGNFGNPHTGDPAAAGRYIETKLSPLARETLFNPELTQFAPSYDGRNEEPLSLPAKIPLLLMQGAEGIAVGMATKVLPHNFSELLEAQIAHLQGKRFSLVPDFLSGGSIDPSDYDDGRGKVKLRAKVEIADEKTLIVREICYGTTTESVIQSIDEAAKKGKIKIDSINDYTAEKIEIEIKLPRGQYAKTALEALYAFTDLEVSINSQIIAIYNNLPQEESVSATLKKHVELLQSYLKGELELEKKHIEEKVFDKSLEQIFIENRLYKKIEEVKSQELVYKTVDTSLKPYLKELERAIVKDDIDRLLSLPLRRISRFDMEKNQSDIKELRKKKALLEQDLQNIKQFTIDYLKNLLKKYGSLYPRKTKIQTMKEIDKKAISEHKVKVCFDPENGFLGTKVSSSHSIQCSNLDKILVFSNKGSYKVINIPDKLYVEGAIWIGPADKKTVINIITKEEKTGLPYAKRFIVKQFILEKQYPYFEEGKTLEYISADSNMRVQLTLAAKAKQKVQKRDFSFEEIPIKGAATRGIKIANQALKKVEILEQGEVS